MQILSPIFKGLTNDEQNKVLLKCGIGKSNLEKNCFLVASGDKVKCIYIVLKGTISVVRDDYWGNRTVISKVTEGGVFGIAYAFSSKETYPISVVANENAEVLLFDHNQLLNAKNDDSCFGKTLLNVISLLAEKDISLLNHIEQVSARTIKQKILSFLTSQAQGRATFSINFDRQELADYLLIDRSALSRELSNLKKQGIIDYHKNNFTLNSLKKY